ncbi:LamG domain-containing protein [Streptomyces sp. NPDC001514]
MTRRWSLIGLIVALAIALTFVIVDISGGDDAGHKAPVAADAKNPKKPGLKGAGWWPADEQAGTMAADAVGNHDAALKGGVSWTAGPQGGGALLLDGATGYADAGAPVIDTARDYSVAARVRIDNKGFRTAVSIDGGKHSVFFLQYSNSDKRFAFSFINQRALAHKVGDPVIGRWYHLTGTYSQIAGTLSIYVDGVLAGTAQARNVERTVGNLQIGRAKFEGKPVDFWSGAIADVHAFNRALGPAEVASLAAREPGA